MYTGLMTAFVSIFLLSIGGFLFLFWKKFSLVKDLHGEEIEARLHSSPSVRAQLKERILEPAKVKFYEQHLPAFWRVLEKKVRKMRMVTLRLETRLARLSDALRGKHINMEVSEKSEYWQTLNGAKQNGNGKAAGK